MAMEFDTQVDFSGGQMNLAARRRSDVPFLQSSARVMQNFRPTTMGQARYRPGRTVLYANAGSRGDYFRVSTGEEFQIRFGSGTLQIVDQAGNTIGSNSGYPWGVLDTPRINWTQAQDLVVMCYPSMQPQMASWDRTARTWSFAPYTFDTDNGVAGVIKRPYFRQSALGATMSYSAVSGSVTLTCSSPYFTNAMIGKTLSIVGQQVTITAVTDSTHAIVTPAYRLPDTIAVNVVDTTPFRVGQIVAAVTQNIKFEVGYVDNVGKLVHGIFLSQITFQAGQYTNADTLVSPLGSSKFGAAAPAAGSTNLPTVQWQEEFMNEIMGWPASVSYDRSRLIFCDFPQAKNAILWSAIAAPQTCWIDSVAAASQPAAGASANAAILSLVSGSPYCKYVVGWQQGQIVFTDRGTFFIAISASNPLAPGSVTFDKIGDDGAAPIRPVTIQDAIVFVNAGKNRVAAVRATGSYSRPMIVEDVAAAHTDLFNNPIQVTIATGDGSFPERYIYVLNGDGSLVVGRVVTAVGEQGMKVGWHPWTSFGAVTWVTASGPNVFYTEKYIAGTYMVSIEDSTAYFDHSIPINSPPANLTPPGAKGIFWQLAGGTVALLDGNIDLGDRPIDANGYLIPFPGEDLTSPTLRAGVFTPAIMQPFVLGQKLDRQKKMNIGRVICNVKGSTDFTIDNRVFTVSTFGVAGDGQPVLLEGNYRCRLLGRQYDPTVQITKHRPGPFELCELTLGVSN